MSGPSLITKREQAIQRFQARESLFCCPLCHAPLQMTQQGSFTCGNRHSFDLSKKGYCNFAGSGALAGYDKALFESRRAILEAGFYNPLAMAIADLVSEYVQRRVRLQLCNVLDAGCGEGFYTHWIGSHVDDCLLHAADLSRDAVALATQTSVSACWCVADLAHLPFRDQTMDIVLNILSPANYQEFGRVLKPGGILIKVVPGNAYLQEIRQITGQAPYSNQDVLQHTQAHMRKPVMQQIFCQKPVTGMQSRDFFRMTPLTNYAGRTESIDIQEITIDLMLLAGRIDY